MGGLRQFTILNACHVSLLFLQLFMFYKILEYLSWSHRNTFN